MLRGQVVGIDTEHALMLTRPFDVPRLYDDFAATCPPDDQPRP